MVTIRDYWSTFTVSQFHNYCLYPTLFATCSLATMRRIPMSLDLNRTIQKILVHQALHRPVLGLHQTWSTRWGTWVWIKSYAWILQKKLVISLKRLQMEKVLIASSNLWRNPAATKDAREILCSRLCSPFALHSGLWARAVKTVCCLAFVGKSYLSSPRFQDCFLLCRLLHWGCGVYKLPTTAKRPMRAMKRKNQSPAVDHLTASQPREPSGSSKDWFDKKYCRKHAMFPNSWTGTSVCRTAFLQLLGIGRGRLARTKKSFRGEDARKYGCLAATLKPMLNILKLFPPRTMRFIQKMSPQTTVSLSILCGIRSRG